MVGGLVFFLCTELVGLPWLCWWRFWAVGALFSFSRVIEKRNSQDMGFRVSRRWMCVRGGDGFA